MTEKFDLDQLIFNGNKPGRTSATKKLNLTELIRRNLSIEDGFAIKYGERGEILAVYKKEGNNYVLTSKEDYLLNHKPRKLTPKILG